MKTKISAFFVYLFVRLVAMTYRFRYYGLENIEQAKSKHANGSYVFAIWHENLIAGILASKTVSHACIVSPSRDGEFVATTLKYLGHVSARGSSSRGGKRAMDEMIKYVGTGIPGAITVDGPRGPRHVPKRGIFEIARATGAPIIPYTAIPKNCWVFKKSWDQTRLPKPFSKILVFYGDPVFIDQNIQTSDLARLSEDLTARLMEGEFAAMRELQKN